MFHKSYIFDDKLDIKTGLSLVWLSPNWVHLLGHLADQDQDTMGCHDVNTLADALVWSGPGANAQGGGDWSPLDWVHLLSQEVDQERLHFFQ